MKIIVLDGRCMTSKGEAHKYMKEKLEMPEYYGENLDALWDVMSSYSECLTVIIENEKEIYEKLGLYGEKLLEVLHDASYENENISVYYATGGQ